MKKPSLLPMLSSGLAMMAFAVGGSGCSSSPTPRDLMAEEAHSGSADRPVAMKGEGTFLDGRVTAVATVSRGFNRGGKGGPGGRERRGPKDGGAFGDYRRSDTDAFGDVFIVGGESEEEQKEAMEDYVRQAKARRAAGSPMPPVTLRVQFENRASAPVTIEIVDVNSDLGNFAARPTKLTLATGEKGVLDPMISQLGVTSDEIPLKLAIRADGKTESQVLLIKNIIAPSLRK
jgi:hypothetical protein